MAYRQISEPMQQAMADGAALVSVGSAGFAWLATANELMQLAASVVAVIAGCAAAWWHIDRIRAARRERENSEEK